ncbi:MAG: tetratricopeptide repeat protein [Candidatus Pristimantibacillus sp.]
MSKLFLFFPLLWLTGNPFVAFILLIVILYVLDRKFIGLTPSFMKPIRRASKLRKLRNHIAMAPNDTSSKQEASRILIEKKQYQEALKLLEPMERNLEDSAEYWDDLGICYLNTGEPERGEEAINRALAINPRVKYGAPYLRLATHYSKSDSIRALAYIDSFQQIQSSSCEAYDRLASIYTVMNRKQDTSHAIDEGLRIYRSLPRYKKRVERKWAIRLKIKKLVK